MKYTKFIFCFIVTLVSACQWSTKSPPRVGTLSRLLIKNSAHEILAVKVKEGFWVTPAVYNVPGERLRTSLTKLVAPYGITITDPKLKGIFLLNVEENSKKSAYTRLFFEVHVKTGTAQTPKEFDEIRWVSMEDATSLMSFEHIGLSIQQIAKYPDTIWGGTFTLNRKNGKMSSKQTEAFYPL